MLENVALRIQHQNPPMLLVLLAHLRNAYLYVVYNSFTIALSYSRYNTYCYFILLALSISHNFLTTNLRYLRQI